ncbi:hypothetical protein C8J56DRAFT_1160182 [Mycena floridula]|nr:hypothetical protein C8J56DRAFT_1160182 [Mycena floridula]
MLGPPKPTDVTCSFVTLCIIEEAPVYLTIGNLPKDIRRKPSRQGQILLAYLPTTNLGHVTSKAARRRMMANLFHACMRCLLAPLKEAGINGIMMESGDGVQRRCHPIYAAYVGDYPEQILVTCAYTGDSPVCECPKHELGDYPCNHPFRNFDDACAAAEKIGMAGWAQACEDTNLRPVQHPFWEDLPYIDVFRSITPDLLHQMYQGVVKHLLHWLATVCDANEIDARVRRLPLNHGLRVFGKGITKLSRVSGLEHKQICTSLLGLITDIRLPGNRSSGPLISATRAMLDFLYQAQYPIHSEATLQELDRSLQEFHDNKHIFIDLGVREHFNIPKLHFLAHYTRAIRFFGTTDNYNTKTTERLHIDFAKDAYRSTNRKDEFKQMTKWLERREKVLHHATYISWRMQMSANTDVRSANSTANDSTVSNPRIFLSHLNCQYTIKMTHHPTLKAVSFNKIMAIDGGYGASLFPVALLRFFARFRFPDLTAGQLEEKLVGTTLPFASVPVFHKIKFVNEALHGNETLNSIHCHPRILDARGRVSMAARFDTALIRVRDIPQTERQSSMDGMRVGHVRLIFSLPELDQVKMDRIVPRNTTLPEHMAYVEWFSKFPSCPEPHLKLYKIKHELAADGGPLVSVLPVSLIRRSIHLYPKWGKAVPSDWTSENVLDMAPAFFVSQFKDRSTYFDSRS